MTLRPRLFLPVLALSFFALMALAVAPSVARADTLTWSAPWYGPADTPNGDAEPIPVASALDAVSFADATHGWAVGLRVDNVILGGGTPSAFYEFTSDGGASWTPSTLTAAGTSELHGVVARSATDVWAVGDAGVIVHYNGITWEKKAVDSWPATNALRAIAFSGSNGWAVGDGYGVALTRDNGGTWTTLQPPGASGALRAVAVVGSGAYAVGDSGTGSGSAMMKRLDVDGSWPASPGTGNALYGISFADAAHGWAVGANATFIHTSDGGSTWTSITDTPIPLLPGTLPASNGLRSIAFADASNGIAIGRYQGVWRTSDGGSSWIVEQIVDGGLGDFDLRGVAFVPGSADHPVVVARHALLSSRDDKSRSYRGTWTLPLTRTLTYTAGLGGTIAGASPQTVALGGNGTLVTAVPNTGYHFVSWSDGSTTAARTDTNVTGNLSVTANFAIDSYTLTYTAGSGGTISGTPIQTVPYGGSGTAVTAVPSTGYHFVTWSDGVTTVARTDSGVVGNVTASATFAANTYQLHYTAGTGGTLGGTINQTVPYGGSGTAVTAVADSGYHFVGWSDGLLTAARTDSSVAANMTVAAVFAVTAPDTRTLTYTAGVGGTIVGTSPQTVSVDGNGTLVTAVPNTGYHFVSWSDGSTTAARTDTVVKADLLVSAVFAVNTYTLTYAAGSGGTISGTVIQTVPYGGSGTAVTAVPNAGYHFVRWSDGVTTVARMDSGVVANIAVSGTFAVDAIDTYTLTYTAGAGGTILGTSPQTVPYGGSGSPVTAVPNAGYRFVSWSDGVTAAARTDTNVIADHAVTATFAPASVATKLTMNVSPTRLSLGHSAHFFGVIAPNMSDGTPIGLLVRKAGQTKWTRVGTYVRTYSAHHWSRYYHPATRGTYYFKVQFSATATYAGSTSRTVTVVWR